MGFWHALLDPENEGHPDVDQVAWKSARHWLQSGAVLMAGSGCGQVMSSGIMATFAPSWSSEIVAMAPHGCLGPALACSHEAIEVLNAGSGPLAPGHIDCGRRVPVVASDGLARFYLQLFVALTFIWFRWMPRTYWSRSRPQFHYNVQRNPSTTAFRKTTSTWCR